MYARRSRVFLESTRLVSVGCFLFPPDPHLPVTRGRGPVLGPMVYGICFCPVSKNGDLKELGVDDSKQLTEEQREKLLQKVLDNNDYLGWAIDILSPHFISTSMYRSAIIDMCRLPMPLRQRFKNNRNLFPLAGEASTTSTPCLTTPLLD